MDIRGVVLRLSRGFLYANALLLINFVVVWFFGSYFYSVTDLLFIEGSIMFIIGGLFDLSTSLYVSKVRETIFHSRPWDVEEHKRAQSTAAIFIITGAILLLEAFLLSSVFELLSPR